MRGIFHIVNLYKLKFNEKTDDPGIKRDDPPVKRDNPPVKRDDPFVKTDYLYEIFKKIFPANQNRAFKFEKNYSFNNSHFRCVHDKKLFLSENDCLNLHYRMITRNNSRYDSLGVKLQKLFFSLFDDFVGSGGARELIRLSIESSCNDLWI